MGFVLILRIFELEICLILVAHYYCPLNKSIAKGQYLLVWLNVWDTSSVANLQIY